MKQTTVCGVGQSLKRAPVEALELLLAQFGRNGPLSPIQMGKRRKVQEALSSK